MTSLDRIRPLARALSEGRTLAVVIAASVALVGAGLAAVLIRSGDALDPGQARLQPEGQVEVSIDGARFAAADDTVVLSEGDRARVRSGRALLELPGEAAAEMRSGSEVRVGGLDAAQLTLEAGDLLVQVEDGTVRVDGGSAAATVDAGVAKLRRSASLVAGVYEGFLNLEGSGRSLRVPRYRQAAVVGAGRLPNDVRPLALSDRDGWDRRLLGPVLQLDQRLVAFGRGFEALLPQSSASPSLYETLLPQLDVTVPSDLLEPRSAGENLIGLSLIALTEGSFEERFEAVFGFRDAGARWGLVAADAGVGSDQAVGTVEAAIDRAPLEVASPPTTGGSTTPTTPPSGPGTTTPGGGGGGDGGGDGGGGSDTTTTTGAKPPGTTTTTQPPVDDCELGLGGLCLL